MDEFSLEDITQGREPIVVADGSNGIAGAPSDEVEVVIVKRGRPQSELWCMFTDEVNACQKSVSMCKYCEDYVPHHHKIDVVRSHLEKCPTLRTIMATTDPGKVPAWYKDLMTQSKKQCQRMLSESTAGDSIMASQTSVVSGSTASSLSSNRRTTQMPITAYALPMLTKAQISQFQTEIANWFYETSTPYVRVENPKLASAIGMIRAGKGLLPTRQAMGSTLLERCYKAAKKQVMKALQGLHVCLVSDSWSNMKNDSVVNYMAVTPKGTYFLEAVHTGEQGHTAKWMADEVDRIFADYDQCIFTGVVTDNTSANKKMWEICQQKYPTKHFAGCVSHTGHLLAKDICCATKTRRNGQSEPTYPDGYPFGELADFVGDVQSVVKFTHNHQAPKAKLEAIRLSTKLPNGKTPRSLARMLPTRWGSTLEMCKTTLENEACLHKLVTDRGFVDGYVDGNRGNLSAKQKAERAHVMSVVTSDDFVRNLNTVVKILQPIDHLIVKFQNDAASVSDVFPDFKKLDEDFKELKEQRIISQVQCEWLCAAATKRLYFVLGKAHGIAYLLDPRYLGDDLPSDMKEQFEQALLKFPIDDKTPSSTEREEMLYVEYNDFIEHSLDQKAKDTITYRMLMKGQKTPLQFWTIDGRKWPLLQMIAVKVFSMATSSAASERNFSVMQYVHTKARNRLSKASFKKEVFIKFNSATFRANKDANGNESDDDFHDIVDLDGDDVHCDIGWDGCDSTWMDDVGEHETMQTGAAATPYEV